MMTDHHQTVLYTALSGGVSFVLSWRGWRDDTVRRSGPTSGIARTSSVTGQAGAGPAAMEFVFTYASSQDRTATSLLTGTHATPPMRVRIPPRMCYDFPTFYHKDDN